jgi:hypothetical protein
MNAAGHWRLLISLNNHQVRDARFSGGLGAGVSGCRCQQCQTNNSIAG